MKILIVDDSSTQRKLIASLLKSIGMRQKVLEADHGQEAIEVLGTNSSDIGLILCDWIMPELSGIEFIEAVRKIPHLKKIPIVMISVEGDPAKIEEAYKKCPDLDGYLVKPLLPEDLKKTLKKAMGRGSD